MGSMVKMNAILKLTTEAGMPASLVVGTRHKFFLKGERIFQFHPVWVTLVHEIAGRWKFVGQAHVMKQTIDSEFHITTGEFIVTRVFPDEIAKIISDYEAPDGESYFTAIQP